MAYCIGIGLESRRVHLGFGSVGTAFRGVKSETHAIRLRKVQRGLAPFLRFHFNHLDILRRHVTECSPIDSYRFHRSHRTFLVVLSLGGPFRVLSKDIPCRSRKMPPAARIHLGSAKERHDTFETVTWACRFAMIWPCHDFVLLDFNSRERRM